MPSHDVLLREINVNFLVMKDKIRVWCNAPVSKGMFRLKTARSATALSFCSTRPAVHKKKFRRFPVIALRAAFGGYWTLARFDYCVEAPPYCVVVLTTVTPAATGTAAVKAQDRL